MDQVLWRPAKEVTAIDVLSWILSGAQWLLAALAAVLLFFLLLLAAALLLPAAFSVRAEGALDADESAEYGFTGGLRWQLHFNWGWSLFRADLLGENLQVTQKQMSVLNFKLRSGNGTAQRLLKRSRSNRMRPRKPRISIAHLRTYWPDGRWLLRRGARDLNLAVLGDVTYGLGDPALTGLTAGILAATGVPGGFRVTPDFHSPGVRGWTALNGRTYGMRLLATSLAFLFRPAIRRLWLSKLKDAIFRRKRREGGSQAA